MYYIIGDIHGYFNRLANLFKKLMTLVAERDTIIFLGDYIDRGAHSYEVIDFLVHVSRNKGLDTVFLKGNHEDMFLNYLCGDDPDGSFIFNGGDATIRSYVAHRGAFEVPRHHLDFFNGLRLYFEGEDFIAVHAGLNPLIETLDAQDKYDLLWIREKFYRAKHRWEKTVIFGHTPVSYIANAGSVYMDDERNIIGIDSGVIFGKSLTCLAWPTRKIIAG